jgi:pyruvate, water dikinase
VVLRCCLRSATKPFQPCNPDEGDEGVKTLIRQAMACARRNHRHAGICGQAPSDHPESAQYLVELGIDSTGVTPDTLLAVTRAVLAIEARLARPA